MRYQKLLFPAALLTVTTATVLAFNFAPERPDASGMTARMAASVVRPVQTESKSDLTGAYLSRAALWPRLRSALRALGDRLERPGKERLVMAGTLRRGVESAGAPFTLTREFPGRMSLEEQVGDNRHVTVFDAAHDQLAARERREADDIETLSFDTAEHFFMALARGTAPRHLGDGFTLDKESTDGRAYNLYEITAQLDTDARTRPQTKTYGLNSATKLLELVKYEINRDGSLLTVEVRLDNWRREQEQMVPHRIERMENGRVVLTLEVNSVAVGPRLDDGAFTVKRAN